MTSEYELDRIVNLTGCLKPCHYTVYSLVGEIPTGKQNYTSVYLQMAKSTNTFKREILGIAIKTFILVFVLTFLETVLVMNISWHIICSVFSYISPVRAWRGLGIVRWI